MNGGFAAVYNARNLTFCAKGFGKLGSELGAEGALDVNGVHGKGINGVLHQKVPTDGLVGVNGAHHRSKQRRHADYSNF